ncbi:MULTISPECIES: ROK family transcriptional regulator [unclassified Streptomyces]|uniref:ROK family transcriptional regulator n=1 Tax=unclassified Streptomyces TaxID=2593676 RepID=UPI001BEA2797|nr:MULTISPECIES: ROK family transcriptional regulator [unclassified Streptomyces]MBT2408328.1 ROK family transcriptional regulator [Streptomyces sp. ISL-21]MBT2613756.1 ROK family transcriptional regulator [Streptomyces sp. ISL-87]
MTTGRSGRTVRDLRRGNRSAVLQRLYFGGPMSRQELGPATGLSSGSVSNVVGELLADGLLEEAGIVDSDGGRPRTLLRVAPDSAHMIGVDVGETRVRVELFDLALTELACTETPLQPRGCYDVGPIVDHVRTGIATVLAEAGVGTDRLLGVGVGVPGIVDRAAPGGAVVHGQTIGWDAVPLEALLRATGALPEQVPYIIDNGARTLGQAEMWFGAGRGARDAVVVLFGSGVGASLITDGSPDGGNTEGTPLEWGHLTVSVRGRRCRCGALGCLEAYTGAESLLARWAERDGGAGDPARSPDSVDEEEAIAALLAAARAADPVAREVLEETAEYLGAGLSDLINLFQPERILIGGWAGLMLGPHILPAVREHATRYALRHPSARVTIDLGSLGPDAVTVGAATLPLSAFFAAGGRPTPPEPATEQPGWRTALAVRDGAGSRRG